MVLLQDGRLKSVLGEEIYSPTHSPDNAETPHGFE
jgi:hypothetical protein